MATGAWTNRGLLRVLDMIRGTYDPANFFVAVVTSAVAPSAATNTLGDLTEIAAGNGYTAGGISIARDNVDFDVLTEDDANGRALLQLKDVLITASGGAIPASGSAGRSLVLLGPHATPASREVLAYWTEDANFSVIAGQTLTIANLELRLKQPA